MIAPVVGRVFNTAHPAGEPGATLDLIRLENRMSARNGERARYHRNRKRRVIQRQRLHALMAELLKKKSETLAASADMQSEGGPAVTK